MLFPTPAVTLATAVTLHREILTCCIRKSSPQASSEVLNTFSRLKSASLPWKAVRDLFFAPQSYINLLIYYTWVDVFPQEVNF